MDIKSQNPGSAPGENQDDDSPEIILPVEAGKLEKALKEVERLQEKVKTLNQSNNSLKKDLQSALEENEFLSFIINEVDVVIYTNTINDDGSWDISWINNRVEEITGFTLSEIRASGTIQHFKDTFAPEHLNLVSDSWQYFMSGEKGNYSGVYRRKHKDGNWKWIYCIGHATQWRPDGSPLQTLCVGFDLTKRINIDKNLRDLLYENLKLKNQDLIETLTKREKQVLKLISKGLTKKEISTKLNISVYTVDSHRKSLLAKLDLKNTAALVRFSAENGLF